MLSRRGGNEKSRKGMHLKGVIVCGERTVAGEVGKAKKRKHVIKVIGYSIGINIKMKFIK